MTDFICIRSMLGFHILGTSSLEQDALKTNFPILYRPTTPRTLGSMIP